MADACDGDCGRPETLQPRLSLGCAQAVDVRGRSALFRPGLTGRYPSKNLFPIQRIATGLIIDCTAPWYLFCPSTNMISQASLASSAVLMFSRI